MVNVIGVRFRHAGKIYYFSPGDLEIVSGEHVIVETARGLEYGLVMIGNKEVDDEKVIQPLKPVLRMATEEDTERAEENRLKEKDAFKICQEKIRKHELEMKLVDVEYTFDNNKILFYFTADGRIDFRELVKDLASVFRTRIELRQIGVRDETKILGGIGICGRPLCCHAHQSEFIPVSIKMAKEQNLSLNPTKISGTCGRLMCCLKHEQETYEDLNSRLPGMGDYVLTIDGYRGEVHSVNVLRQTVKVLLTLEKEEKELRDYAVAELRFRPRRRKDKGAKGSEIELTEDELRALEDPDYREPRAAVEPKAHSAQKEQKEPREHREHKPKGHHGAQNRHHAEKSSQEHGKAEHAKSEHGKTEHGKAEHGKSDYGRSEHIKSEHARPERTKAEHGKSEHGKSEHGKSEHGKAEYGKSERGRQDRGRQNRHRSNRSGQGRQRDNHREGKQENHAQ